MSAFLGQSVFITGAGQGIGYALCSAFAQAGAWVGLNDLDPDLAQQATDAINASIGQARVSAVPCDVADTFALEQAFQGWVAQHGRLDVVIANAGITDYGTFLQTTPADFDRVTGVNLRGSYFTAQYAARQMVAQGRGGRILLMSSVVGLRAHRNLTAYGATKAGIAHMATLLALELGEHGITVNALAPGATLTERTLQDDPHYAENWASVSMNRRCGTVDDVVNAALFLASPASGHITAQTLVVDGGWTGHSPLATNHPDLPIGR